MDSIKQTNTGFKKVTLNEKIGEKQPSWEIFPGIKYSFQWIIQQIKVFFFSFFVNFKKKKKKNENILNNELSRIAPTTLRLLDHYQQKSRIIGTKVLFHLLSYMNINLFQKSGLPDIFEQVIFSFLILFFLLFFEFSFFSFPIKKKALFSCLTLHEPELTDSTITCLIFFIEQIYGLDTPTYIAKLEKIFYLQLKDANFEQKIALRKVFFYFSFFFRSSSFVNKNMII